MFYVFKIKSGFTSAGDSPFSVVLPLSLCAVRLGPGHVSCLTYVTDTGSHGGGDGSRIFTDFSLSSCCCSSSRSSASCATRTCTLLSSSSSFLCSSLFSSSFCSSSPPLSALLSSPPPPLSAPLSSPLPPLSAPLSSPPPPLSAPLSSLYQRHLTSPCWLPLTLVRARHSHVLHQTATRKSSKILL